MKLASFEVQTAVGPQRRIGALLDGDENRIVDLTSAYTAYLQAETDEPTPRELALLRTPPDMIGFLRGAHKSREAADQALAFVRKRPDARGAAGEQLLFRRADVRLLAPVPRPNTLRDFSIFETHMSKARENPAPKAPYWYRIPQGYKGNPGMVLGPDDPIPFPTYTDLLDPEFEIGIIVGKGGTNFTLEEAKQAIAGYTILVDHSARDKHAQEQFGPAKSKDFGTHLGPYLVTPDEADEGNLHCRLLVDGEVWWEGDSSEPRGFLAHHLVAYASDHEQLHPGDVLGTGTIGMSCSMDTKRWVKVGQTVRFEAGPLGVLEQKVVSVPGNDISRTGLDGLLKPPEA
ncbi:MAG TPA: fumarylacetoacetate hydrolase family protein [Chloroflexota bacterium]|nr:fumarylacetoacetate hydrolase family protein [Chloroflexota bacterium]